MAGATGWAANQFAPATDTYYVRALTGALRGYFFTVLGSDGTSVLIDDAGIDLTQLSAGDQLELVPYWTLGTLYPASQTGVSFVASASSVLHQTELYMYDPAGIGSNRSPTATYFYYNGAWRKTGSAIATSYSGVVVPPDTYIVQRNKAAGTVLTQMGRVHPSRLTTPIEAVAGTKQDNYVALAYPVDVTLRGSGLAGSAAFTTSSSTVLHADEVYVYDNTQTGINRAPAATYYYYNGGWRKTGAPMTTDFGDTVTLTAGSGFVVRRAADETTGTWSFDTNL